MCFDFKEKDPPQEGKSYEKNYRFLQYKMQEPNTNTVLSTALREWITSDCRNTLSTTNPEDEGIADAPGNDGNKSMPEQVKRTNPWKIKEMMMMMMAMMMMCFKSIMSVGSKKLHTPCVYGGM